MSITRRGFLAGILGAAAAPAIVRSEWVMPLGRVLVPKLALPPWFGLNAEELVLRDLGEQLREGLDREITGGYLVPIENRAFIDQLRNRSITLDSKRWAAVTAVSLKLLRESDLAVPLEYDVWDES